MYTDHKHSRDADMTFDLHLPYTWKPYDVSYPTYDELIELNMSAKDRSMTLHLGTCDSFLHGNDFYMVENYDPTEKDPYKPLDDFFLQLREDIYGRDLREI